MPCTTSSLLHPPIHPIVRPTNEDCKLTVRVRRSTVHFSRTHARTKLSGGPNQNTETVRMFRIRRMLGSLATSAKLRNGATSPSIVDDKCLWITGHGANKNRREDCGVKFPLHVRAGNRKDLEAVGDGWEVVAMVEIVYSSWDGCGVY